MLSPPPGESPKYGEGVSNAVSLCAFYYQFFFWPGEGVYVPDAYCRTRMSDLPFVLCLTVIALLLFLFAVRLTTGDLRFWQPVLRWHLAVVLAFEVAVEPFLQFFGNPPSVGWARFLAIRLLSPIVSAGMLVSSLC
ncbi:hypothetical protein HK405_002050, partial [Cladochytrium tenue]